MSRKRQEQWDLAVQIPAVMRKKGLTFHEASQFVGIDAHVGLELIHSVVRRKGRSYQVKPKDRLLRVLLIPSRKGLREIVTTDSREASVVGEFWNAVERALGPKRDEVGLRSFRPRTVKDSNGKRVRLLTDVDELKRLASAGKFSFESIYAGRA